MNMDLSEDFNPQFTAHSLKFQFYSSEQIKALSVKEITNVETFNSLNHPSAGGLYDAALGPTDSNDVCFTCGQTAQHCPGHMGHIELALPVFKTVIFPTLYKIIKATCFHCHRLSINVELAARFIALCRLLKVGKITESTEFEERFMHLSEESTGDKDTNNFESFVASSLKAVTDDQVTVSVKNIEAVKMAVHRKFIKENMKNYGKCVHCSAIILKVREENKARVFLIGKPINTSKKTSVTSRKDTEDSNVDMQDQSDVSEDEAYDSDLPRAPKRKKQKLESDTNAKSKDVILLTALKIKEHMRLVWSKDNALLLELFPMLRFTELDYPTDIFFMDVVPVPPNRFRPISVRQDKKFEHAQSANLLRVLKGNVVVKEILWEMEKQAANTQIDGAIPSTLKEVGLIPGKTIVDKLSNSLTRLQTLVNAVVDSDLDKLSSDSNPGIKQILEKKEGLFRKNMMGKRVNFAARSVISPDPNINTCEIGIPEVFAKVLTYPQPVTPWNAHQLRQAVINGPNIYPGATHVVNEDGSVTRLDDVKMKREAIANQLLTPFSSHSKAVVGTKKVLRHLKNGDMVLINRQPTLHKSSIQAHKARVLPGEKTLRLHYSNCNAYNADFDGDEINAHFPQNEIARSEALNIASTDYQYLVPKDGTPLAGLMQDHIVSGASLTIRGKFFNKDDYCQLVYGALTDKKGPIKILPPSIVKPVQLWSGKQVLSTLVLNVIPDNKPALSLTGTAKVPEMSWIKMKEARPGFTSPLHMGESDVIIREGELLCGILEKGHYGPTPFGLIHCCYELYGGAVTGQMITCFGRLFTNYLQWIGFTLGVEDILLCRKADKERRRIIRKSPRCGLISAKNALGLDSDCDDSKLLCALKDAHFSKTDHLMRELDRSMRTETTAIQEKIVGVCIPNGLEKLFPQNNLQLMVQSGAKGSKMNCIQISCLLGQIELEGKRPPLMLSGKTLPSFLPYDVTPRAGGFVTGRFLTGIRQQEYFFHCMAGREGLVDTAVKTSRSGYLQRCLIKHLEGVRVNYDLTVRDSDNSVIQFYYGEDGLDICKTSFLNSKQLPFLVDNHHILVHRSQLPPSKLQNDNQNTVEKVTKLEKKIHKWQKKNGNVISKVRQSGFLRFCQLMEGSIEIDDNVNEESTAIKTSHSQKSLQLKQMWQNLSDKKKYKYAKKIRRCPDPVTAKYKPYCPRVMPEKLGFAIKDFAKHISKAGTLSEDALCDLMSSKLQQSIADPGEPVGLLCAQSIGEPSTQMTLNTFHFAGRGEMNVTLGIPRLREVLMVGGVNIKTPAIDVPVFDRPEAIDQANRLQKKFTRVFLNDVLEDIQVCDWSAIVGLQKNQRRRMFKITFSFLRRCQYKENFPLTPAQILQFMEKVYIKKLVALVKVKIKAQTKKRMLSHSTQKRSRNPNRHDSETEESQEPIRDEDVDDEPMDDDDDDAMATSEKRKKAEEHEYDDEEEEEGGKPARDAADVESDDCGVDMDEDIPETEDINEELINEYEDKIDDNPKTRINNVLALAVEVEKYTYDTKRNLSCEVTLAFPLLDSKIDLLALVKQHVLKVVVHEVTGITRCILTNKETKNGTELHLITEGINMHMMYKYCDILDINRLYCNNIHSVANTYGIEAAGKVIIQEIKSVFAAYKIEVNYRHLSLLADYMTFEGTYKPFNRLSLETNPSPIQKMTFESTMKFLVESSVSCSADELRSPSAQLVLGKTITSGTGCVDMFVPLHKF